MSMRVALLGPTGRIGSAFLKRAIVDGHEVRVLVREAGAVPPAAGLTVVHGDARDPDAVAQLVASADAVVSAVGPRANTPEAVTLLETTAQNVIAAMHFASVRRVVFIAGAGVALPGERRTFGQRLISGLVRRLARWVVVSKEREFALYLQSDLDWTAIRPPRVVDGPATGRAHLRSDRPSSFRVTSGDVAAVITQVLVDHTTIRQAPYVSS